MAKQTLTPEQKRVDIDIWIIVLVTLGTYVIYTITKNQLMNFIKNSEISVITRLLLNVVVQFGVAGMVLNHDQAEEYAEIEWKYHQ